MKKNQIVHLSLSAMLLAIGLVLPFLTGQVPQFGSMLLPLHLPALICGFVCGWGWGMAVGFVLPLLRSVLFGMPPMIPTALCMAFEMAAYGAAAGLLYRFFAGRRGHIYLSLVGAMLIGRVVWGIVSFAVYALLTEKTFSLTAFWMGGFANAWPGIVLQLVLVPLIVAGLERARLIPPKQEDAGTRSLSRSLLGRPNGRSLRTQSSSLFKARLAAAIFCPRRRTVRAGFRRKWPPCPSGKRPCLRPSETGCAGWSWPRRTRAGWAPAALRA